MNGHEVALWSGVAAFFASLLAVGIFDVIDVGQWAEYLGAFIVAGITAGAVYAQQRLEDAKKDRGGHADTKPTRPPQPR